MGNGIVHTYQVLDKVYLDVDDLVEFASDETNDKIIIKGRLYQSPQHGHWERLYANNYKCSVCGSWWTDDGDTYLIEFNYCPNCGAKMDAKGEDDAD